jgi:DNA polymerase (family 10)
VDNTEIAKVLFELADVLELSEEPAFKVRAFRSAAQIIEKLAEPAHDLLQKGTLTKVKGIGAGVARRVTEILERGDLAELEERRKLLPPGLVDLTRITGVGLKTAALVWRELGVSSVDDLEAAAQQGKLRALPKFGQRKEEKILQAITAAKARAAAPTRWTLGQAISQAEPLVALLRAVPGVLQVELAGSIRRRRDTIGDIDILVAAPLSVATAVMDTFTSQPVVSEVLGKGDTKSSVLLRDGLQVDVRVVLPESWGAALQYFTGSKDHNVAVRSLAVRRKLKISEYAVTDEHGAVVAGADEQSVYASVGLTYIPPELRENRGEIEAAAEGRLPTLVELADLRGDLHMHTVETDGKSTLEQMVEAARAMNREYIAITDHSQALTIAKGLDPERLRAQGALIRAMNEKIGGRPRILRGIEADILPDGSVDLGPEVLRELDWVIGSVHSHFTLSREDQTRRVVRALESGVVDCVGHPTGRILTRREPYPIDLEAVLAAAKRVGAAIECNAFPNRLDLDEHGLRLAREMGVTVVISSDSHHTSQQAHLRLGVDIARRAWLQAEHVANTIPLKDFLDRFAHHHRRATA